MKSMQQHVVLRFGCLALLAFSCPWNRALAQQDPAVRQALDAALEALDKLANQSDEESIFSFIEEHLAESLVEQRGVGQLLEDLENIRASCANPDVILPAPEGSHGLRVTFGGNHGYWEVLLRADAQEPRRLVELSLRAGQAPEAIQPLEWESYQADLKRAEGQGFSGTVLILREGKLLHHQAYGMRDRATGSKNTTNTVYAIGSIPIDFTNAAILQLWDRGQLDLEDRLGEFFNDVPEDKQGISLQHLMSGRSGLPNFHHLRGVDADRDLSYIDRNEAVRRILAAELLFEPGRGQAQSHSAWGLLAAVVEVVSEQTYDAYLKSNFFEPMGMKHTGHYDLAKQLGSERLAVGVPRLRQGELNTPENWGPSSWLVIGSGGMLSNPADLLCWLQGMAHGDYLSPKARQRYLVGGTISGSNDRGFHCVYNQGPDNLAIVCTNSLQPGLASSSVRLAEGLVMMAD